LSAPLSRGAGCQGRDPRVALSQGQRNELDVLANSCGSAVYERFLNSLGSLVPLRGNNAVYLGGLDT
jgi:hypothetical protein